MEIHVESKAEEEEKDAEACSHDKKDVLPIVK